MMPVFVGDLRTGTAFYALLSVAACGPSEVELLDDPVPEPVLQPVPTTTSIGEALAADDDRLYVTSGGPDGYMLAVAMDLDGNELWTAPTRRCVGHAVVEVSASGELLWSNSSEICELTSELIAFDREGTELWRRGSLGDPTQAFVGLLSAHESEPIVAAASRELLGVDQIDAGGWPVWSVAWDDHGCRHLTDIAVSVDGGLIVVGSAQPEEGCWTGWLQRYDGQGNLLWSVERPAERGGSSGIHAITAVDHEHFVLVGADRPGGELDYATAPGVGWIEVIDGEGERMWRTYVELDRPNVLDSVVVDADGFATLGRVSEVPDPPLNPVFDVLVQRFNFDGDLVWSTSVGNIGGSDIPAGIVSTGRGIYFTYKPALGPFQLLHVADEEVPAGDG